MYRTEIYIWSRIGCTPITKREGAYCDVLVHKHIECASPEVARREVELLIESTQYGDYGHFSMPDHPNQNTRNSFVSRRWY
jgi:hypothetical protein